MLTSPNVLNLPPLLEHRNVQSYGLTRSASLSSNKCEISTQLWSRGTRAPLETTSLSSLRISNALKGRKKNNLMWVRRSSRLKESKARRMHYGACGSLAVRVEVVYLCRRRSGSHTSPHSITHPARYACHGHSPDHPTHFSTARSPPQTCCGPYPAVPMEKPQVPIAWPMNVWRTL